jgi:hypothetical protein
MFRNMIQELSLVASSRPLPELLRFILDRTGYRKMLEAGKDAGSGSAPGEPGRVINAARKRPSAANRSAIFWITRRWWRTPTRSTSARPSR